jgi:hypothetical protein
LQFENGITGPAIAAISLSISETLVRFGFSTRIELRLDFPNYSTDVSGGSVATGFSDIAVGAKRQLGPLWRNFDLAVIAAVSLPTGAAGISSHGFDTFIKLPWSKDLVK